MVLPAYRPDEDGWHKVGALQWRRDGDVFSFVWPDHRVGIGLENIKESSSGEMHAEVTVERTANGQSRHLHLARLNLLSTTARDSLGRSLTERLQQAGMAKEEIPPWKLLLEAACTLTVRQWRIGSPFVDLGLY